MGKPGRGVTYANEAPARYQGGCFPCLRTGVKDVPPVRMEVLADIG